MAPHAMKRRKVTHQAISEDEDGGSVSDMGSANVTDDGSVAIEENRSPGRKYGAPKSTKSYLDQTRTFSGGAYHSNIFKLQVDELLVKVRPKYGKRMTKVENVLRKLKGIIESIPSREALSVGREVGLHTKSL